MAADGDLVREAITYLLESIPDLELVAACDDADELLATVAAQQPDLVVLGVGLPGTEDGDGVRIADRLRAAAADVAVLEIGREPDLRVRQDGGRKAYLRRCQLLDRDRLAAALDEVVRTRS